MDDRLIVDMLQRNIGERIELAAKLNVIRARCIELEHVNSQMVMGCAEAEPAVAALDKWEAYLMEKVRLEREACTEPDMWARTLVGNSIALTLYQDLANQLARIRKGYGV